MDNTVWIDMFQLTVPVLEKILRPIVIYAFLIIGLRLAGKRELAQLNPFDIIVLLTLSNTVQNAIIGNDNTVTGGLIGASTLFIVNYCTVRFLFNHERLERIVVGEADVLIENGVIKPAHLRSEFINLEELAVAAHKQGFASLDDVERAVLEPEGVISFEGKKPFPDVVRHQELLEKLNQISAELALLRARGAS